MKHNYLKYINFHLKITAETVDTEEADTYVATSYPPENIIKLIKQW